MAKEDNEEINKFPILTWQEKEGYASHDTSVHVSYSFNLKEKNLEKFEIAGYFTRFSLDSDIVNLCQGGGMIPTLIEK